MSDPFVYVKSWYVVEAVDRSGKTAYLLNARTLWENDKVPGNVNGSYASYRWRKLFSNLWYHQNDPVRRALLAYVCRQHPGFARVSLRYREQAVRADGALRDHGLVSGYSCTEPRAGNPG